jgi:sister chromatid cohesion protein DCC1
LDTILAERPLGGLGEEEEKENGGEAIGKTWDELLGVVQASHEELRVALRSRSAVCIDGRWRGVLPSHMTTLLELLLLTCVERGWALTAVPSAEAALAMEEHGFHPQLTKHCLRQLMSTNESTSNPMDTLEYHNGEDGESDTLPHHVSLDQEAVCHHFGTKLLRERPRWDSVEEFLDAWTAAVPEGYCVPAVEMLTLSGEALFFEPHGGAGGLASYGIERFSVTELSAVPAERFGQLFSKRPKWELSTLEPYIRGLAGHGETIETLLLKYARASQQRPTEPVAYSAR